MRSKTRSVLAAAAWLGLTQAQAGEPPPAESVNTVTSPAPASAPAPPASLPLIAYAAPASPPNFIAYSSKAATAGVLLGAVGGMAVVGMMIAEGNRIVRESEIHDPAIDIARRVAELYGHAHGLALAGHPIALHGEKLAAAAGSAKTVIEVQTTSWGFFPTAMVGPHFEAAYAARLTLVNVANGAVVIKDKCVIKVGKKPDAPGHEQLLADNAALLKQQLSVAADACVEQLRVKALGH
jgi:hypothetical protein